MALYCLLIQHVAACDTQHSLDMRHEQLDGFAGVQRVVKPKCIGVATENGCLILTICRQPQRRHAQ